MTLREWAIAYTLQFGRSHLYLQEIREEVEFIERMVVDLNLDMIWFKAYVLLSDEFRRMKNEQREVGKAGQGIS